MNVLKTALEAIETLLTDNTSESALAQAADARIKLMNAMAVKPAAWMTQDGVACIPLYMHPPQPLGTPEGYVLVPIEVQDLYNFITTAFVPMTPQQKEIWVSMDLARKAMAAADAMAASHKVERDALKDALNEAVSRLVTANLESHAWKHDCDMLRAERDALKADAERYRYLRSKQMQYSLPNDTVALLVSDVTALDATMEETK